jgi:DNA-binding LacI/PurR family transcriptional regulator
MASRKDVAAAAGVSVRTVSNVVNGFEHVAPATRDRVLEAIERLSYRPSELARSLKVGRSGLIGLMLPELDTPYFAEITRAFVEQGTRHGLTVVIDQTDGDRTRELAWMQRTAQGSLFDALLLSPLGLKTVDLDLLPPDAPVVFLGEDRYPGFDLVTTDGHAAARDAVNHLIAGGRRRIGAIGAERPARATSTQRLGGWRSALKGAGLPAGGDLVAYVRSFKRSQGHAGMLHLLDGPAPPDAVFCFSDPIALGAIRALHERGLRVPEDVAVVGFDDIEDGRYSCPTLTSIRPDKARLAELAFDRLLRRMEGEALAPAVIDVPYDLVVRESSG